MCVTDRQYNPNITNQPNELFFVSQILPGIKAICTDNQADVTFDGNVTKCCDTCQPGYGVVEECTSDNQTRCETCISGETYSSYRDHTSSCKQCATCGVNPHFILHPCNVTHNTVCGCSVGSYYDPEADVCKFCDLCRFGEGVVRKCSNEHNSICKPCVENKTYSDTVDPFTSCKYCSVCKQNMVVLQECSTTEDTLCFSMYHFLSSLLVYLIS